MIDPQTEHLWLKELHHSAKSIEVFYRSRKWDFKTEFEIEKLIFLGFFSIRKLLDIERLKNMENRNISLTEYPQSVDEDEFDNTFQRKWQDIYDFSKGTEVSLSLRELCNQFIHSKIYSDFVLNNNEWTCCFGFFFASERKYKTSSSDFSVGEFKNQDKDVSKLCQVINEGGYEIAEIKASVNTIDWLNEILQSINLYKQIIANKQIVLTDVLKNEIGKLNG